VPAANLLRLNLMHSALKVTTLDRFIILSSD